MHLTPISHDWVREHNRLDECKVSKYTQKLRMERRLSRAAGKESTGITPKAAPSSRKGSWRFYSGSLSDSHRKALWEWSTSEHAQFTAYITEHAV
jgi:hypothetical protein